jgi:adenylylsulfate kinase
MSECPEDAGVVVWLTGLPSSGKSTLARRLAEALRKSGRAVVLLDGDDVRASLVPAPCYDAVGRSDFYESLARLAALLAHQGFVVLVPATAHRAIYRRRAALLAPRFIEVLVDTPAERCAERDPRGLWAGAHAGRVDALPGAGVAYEPPEAPDVTATGGLDDAARDRIVAALEARVSSPERAAPGG